MTNVTRKRHQFTVIAKPTRRPLEFVLLGLFLVVVAGGLLYDYLRGEPTVSSTVAPYSYSIKQSADVQTFYRENSFFGTTPDPSNTAYLTAITKAIKAQPHFTFDANEATNLTYQYGATARLQALYTDNSDSKGSATVWSKQYTLLAPATKSQDTSHIEINPTLQIPFADYFQQSEQFRNAFSAPTTSELTVDYTVLVQGQVRGQPLKETKTTTLIIPLDQQVFKIATKFEKSSSNKIMSANTKQVQKLVRRVEVPAATILLVVAFVAITYGLRKQKIKTPYQRELEKIYRYHNGIIIQAKRPPDLDHKNIVVIKNFDDMLNLEEELKTPIIASKVSDYTTHFFIANDNIIYVYTVGVMVPFKDTPLSTA